MHIEKVTEYEHFTSLKDEWNTFLDRCEWSCVSLTHDWLSSWWKAFGDNATLWVLLMREQGCLKGIVPLMLRRERFHGLPVQALTLMLNGHTPVGGFLFERPESCFACFLEFLEENRREWDVLRLQKLPQKVFNGTYFNEAMEQRGLPVIRTDSFHVPYTDIQGSWEDYYAGRPKKFKKVMRNKLNRMTRDGLLSAEAIPTAEIGTGVFDEMVDVSRRSWKGRIKRAIPDDAQVQEFYKIISEALGRSGKATLWLMRRNGKAIAFEYHVRHRGITYPIRADFDEDYHALSPGSLLEYLIMKQLFSDPTIHGYNSCGQTYEYLMNWATTVVEHVNIHVFNTRSYSKNLFLLESRILPVMREAKSFFSRSRMRKEIWDDQENSSES